MTTCTVDIVAKLWNLSRGPRDGGVISIDRHFDGKVDALLRDIRDTVWKRSV